MHFQWSKHIVFDEESDCRVKNTQFQRPEARIYKTTTSETLCFNPLVNVPLILFYVVLVFQFVHEVKAPNDDLVNHPDSSARLGHGSQRTKASGQENQENTKKIKATVEKNPKQT